MWTMMYAELPLSPLGSSCSGRIWSDLSFSIADFYSLLAKSGFNLYPVWNGSFIHLYTMALLDFDWSDGVGWFAVTVLTVVQLQITGVDPKIPRIWMWCANSNVGFSARVSTVCLLSDDSVSYMPYLWYLWLYSWFRGTCMADTSHKQIKKYLKHFMEGVSAF